MERKWTGKGLVEGGKGGLEFTMRVPASGAMTLAWTFFFSPSLASVCENPTMPGTPTPTQDGQYSNAVSPGSATNARRQ